MGQSSFYAHLKTIDGEEVMEFKRENFEKIIKNANYRTLEREDRTLYFLNENLNSNGLNLFKDDYFEVMNS